MSRVRTVTLLEKVLYPLYELRLKRELRGKKHMKIISLAPEVL